MTLCSVGNVYCIANCDLCVCGALFMCLSHICSLVVVNDWDISNMLHMHVCAKKGKFSNISNMEYL